jgi:hypothetical protein
MSRLRWIDTNACTKSGFSHVANRLGVVARPPDDGLGVFHREVRCYRNCLALLEFVDDFVWVQGHVYRVVFSDGTVSGQQIHHLCSLVLVELAPFDFYGLLRPTVT